MSDRGIGMTSSVVLNYFLKAGASFRRSDVWRRQHESDSGESRVLRSGRFGVGALAVFLVGDEIEVSTRHISAPAEGGISFTATLDSEEIQLNHFTRPVGTTIRVKVSSDDVWKTLAMDWQWQLEDQAGDLNPLRQWDFYCISGLSVKRVLCYEGKIAMLPQRWHFPAPFSDLLPPWHRLAVAEYADVQWANHARAPRLLCNGIVVTERPYYDPGVAIGEGLFLHPPTVSVFDPDGRLPLNLQRTGLAVRNLPFEDQLLESQCEDFVAWALVNAPTVPLMSPGEAHDTYPSAKYERPRHTFAFVAEGSVLVDSWTFKQISPAKVIFFPSAGGITLSAGVGELLVPLDLEGAGNDVRKAWFRCTFAWNWRGALKPFARPDAAGCRTILRTSFYRVLRKPGAVAQFLWDDITVEPSNKRWTILHSGDCSSGRIDFPALLDSPEDAEIEGLTEYFLGPVITTAESNSDLKPSRLARVWKRVAGDVIVPYDLDQRKQRFHDAYRALRPMIEYYEDVKETASVGGSRRKVRASNSDAG